MYVVKGGACSQLDTAALVNSENSHATDSTGFAFLPRSGISNGRQHTQQSEERKDKTDNELMKKKETDEKSDKKQD